MKSWLSWAAVIAAGLMSATVARSDQDEAIKLLKAKGATVIVDKSEKDKPVVVVDLAGSEVKDDDLKLIKEFKSLNSLKLNQNITDAGLKELKDLPDLQSLSLSNSKITDAGLKELKAFKKLRTVYMIDTQITDAGLKDLKDLPILRYLDLCGTKITDDGLKELKAIKSLQVLVLQKTKVTDAGVKELRAALPELDVQR